MYSPSDTTTKFLVVLVILGMVAFRYQFQLAELINGSSNSVAIPSLEQPLAQSGNEDVGTESRAPGWGIRKFQYHPESTAFSFEVFTDITGSVHYQNKFSMESIPRRNAPMNPEITNFKPSEFTVRIGPDGFMSTVLNLQGKHLTPGLYRVTTNYVSGDRVYHWVITYRWSSSNQITDIEKRLHEGHKVLWD